MVTSNLAQRHQHLGPWLDLLLQEEPTHRFLLLAPPAWGKTQLLLSRLPFWAAVKKRVIYCSPLCALNREAKNQLQQAAQQISAPFFVYEHQGEKDLLRQHLELSKSQGGLILLTPERWWWTEYTVDWAQWANLMIIDEFHLLEHWSSFRPALEEVLLWLSAEQQCARWYLTATFNIELLQKDGWWQNWQQQGQSPFYVLTAAPAVPLRDPRGLYCFAPRQAALFHWSQKAVIWGLKRGEVCLLFVYRRQEVDHWVRFARYWQIPVLGAKGGETAAFIEALERWSKQGGTSPLLIVTTTCLSHGVNLPALRYVVLSYAPQEEAFFWQMIGRAGRRGETYEILCLAPKWQHIWVQQHWAPWWKLWVRLLQWWLGLWFRAPTVRIKH